MTAIRGSDIQAALLQKGFREDNTHHRVFWLYHGGRKTGVKTRLSHGTKDYGDSLLAQIKRQLRISKSQLLDLVQCPMSYEAYVEHLLRTGNIRVS